jgi:FG-GAP-like repeat/FG-GAP repeat
MSVRKPKHAIAPQLLRLECRDVPATFYVDPILSGAVDGTLQTFNSGKFNQVPSLVYGSNAGVANAVLFPTLSAALTKAAASAGADTIQLAHGTISVDNSGGAVQVNDSITLIGSGQTNTTLMPTTNSVGAAMLVTAGKSLTATGFTYDGATKTVGTAFFIQSGTGIFTSVTVANAKSGNNQGTAIAADAGSYVEVVGATITGYDRIGVSIYDSMGSVYNSTITGLGVVAGDFANYGVQVAGNSKANIVGNLITGNQDTTAGGEQSAGIYLFEDVAGAPTATVTTNNFANNTYGALVGFARGADASTATITRNNFATTNAVGLVAENNSTVDARRNFWGFRNGPDEATNNPNGQGVLLDDQVDYRHWLEYPFEQGEIQGNYTIGPGNGGFTVYGLTPSGGLAGTTPTVFGGTWAGEVRVASGDVNGDKVLDRIVGIGSGGGSRVQVFHGVSNALIFDFSAYVAGFTGGVYVASGDVNGDGRDDIITGAGFGGGPHVKVFDGASGAEIRSFFAFGTSYTGGVSVASGDFDNDTFDDIVAGTVTCDSRVTVFGAFYNPTTGAAKLQDFLAYPSFDGGVYVAAGDLNGDGRADLITGAGATGGSHVRAWSSNLNGTKGALIGNFIVPGLETFTGGIRVAARDVDNDGCEDILIATGPGIGSDTTVRVVNAANVGLSAPPVSIFAPWGAYALTTAFDDGLFVG